MARHLLTRPAVGERLLASKLQILKGTGDRHPSVALSILTGRVAEDLSLLESLLPTDRISTQDNEASASDPVVNEEAASERVDVQPNRPSGPQYSGHTVYLSQAHLRDIESIIEVLSRQQVEPRRLTRSAVLRRAVEHLRTAVESDSAESMLEND